MTNKNLQFIGYPHTDNMKQALKEFCLEPENTRRLHEEQLNFVGTVKAHGTNVSIVKSPNGDIYCQSRNNVLYEDSKIDGYGVRAFFNQTFENHTLASELFVRIEGLCQSNGFNTQGKSIVVYGEFAGGNIQKNVALCKLERAFYIFAICLCENSQNRQWVPIRCLWEFQSFGRSELTKSDTLRDEKTHSLVNMDKIYSITQFGLFQETCNKFADIEKFKVRLNNLTLQVCKKCPIGEYFGVLGMGEGIVWCCIEYPQLRFKNKGEDFHQKACENLDETSIRKRQPKPETLTTQAFGFCVQQVNGERLQQGLQLLREKFENNVSRKQTNDFADWICQDILREESHTISELLVENKESDLIKQIKSMAIKWFLTNHETVTEDKM